ncbi:Uncharacterised protein [Vibrio cholerae]|nr:Uncharacterised protein [Vibrio cholerae]CRZ96310.1 Uncharacterised protein [Vibrio cholerae]CSB18994.1 Uncharacterised protein [Vibrio cholerae]CSB25709.1 Uncharacterised protein [Vibrio cholerae]CSB44564.1 Uncharacterised protein [Vibrio cholerae]
MFKYALRKSMGRWVFFPICCVLIPVVCHHGLRITSCIRAMLPRVNQNEVKFIELQRILC